MKVRQAMICMNCEEVALTATHCPICESASTVPLSQWVRPLDEAKETLGKRENLVSELDMMRRSMREMLYDLGEDCIGVGA